MCEVRFEGEDGEKVMREGVANATAEGSSQGQNSTQHTVQENAEVPVQPDAGQAFVQQEWQNYGLVPGNTYPGFQPPQEDTQMTDTKESYAIAVGVNNLQSQLMMGESGSGMKWYPNVPPQAPQANRPRYKTRRGHKSAATRAARDYNLAFKVALVEPGTTVQDAGAPESHPAGGDTDQQQQPVVVSSVTAGLDSA